MVGAVCFYAEPLHLCWEQPKLLLSPSLLLPGMINTSNRSGRSSISLGSRISNSLSWYLISNFSTPFPHNSKVTSCFPQLTNLWPTLHTTEKLYLPLLSRLPFCLSFPLLGLSLLYSYHLGKAPM